MTRIPTKSLLAVFKRSSEKFELFGNTNQPRYVELWCEAAGMVPQLKRVAHEYGVPVRSCGGFDSLSVKHDFVEEVLGRNQPTLVLQCGDLDPSGVSILDSFASDISQFVADYKALDITAKARIAMRLSRNLQSSSNVFLCGRSMNARTTSFARTSQRKRKLLVLASARRHASVTTRDLIIRYKAEAFAPDVLATVVRAAIKEVVDLDILAKTRKRGLLIRKE